MEFLKKRSHLYAFSSLTSLKKYFRQFFDPVEIEEIIEKAKEGFAMRSGCSSRETELQFVKKCEFQMLRMIRERSEHMHLYG